MVLNLQKDRNSPFANGYKNPTQNAANVGSINSHPHRRIGLVINRHECADASRFLTVFIARLLILVCFSVYKTPKLYCNIVYHKTGVFCTKAFRPRAAHGASSEGFSAMPNYAQFVVLPHGRELALPPACHTTSDHVNCEIGNDQAFSLAYCVAQPCTKAVLTASQSPVPAVYCVRASTTAARQSSTAGVQLNAQVTT